MRGPHASSCSHRPPPRIALRLRTPPAEGTRSRLTFDSGVHFNPAWSPDGKFLVCLRATGPSGNGIFAMPLAGDRTPRVVVPSPSLQTQLTFPSGAGKWQVSGAVGDMPVWRRDGREIYFAAGSELAVAEVGLTGTQFNPGPPRSITPFGNAIANGRIFDAMPDGSRFIAPLVPTDAAALMHLLVNRPAELEARK